MRYLLQSLINTNNRLHNHRTTLDPYHYGVFLTARLDNYACFFKRLITEVINNSPIPFPRPYIYNLLSKLNKFLDLSSSSSQDLPYLASVGTALYSTPSLSSRLETIAEIIIDSWNIIFYQTRIQPEITQLPGNVNNLDYNDLTRGASFSGDLSGEYS